MTNPGADSFALWLGQELVRQGSYRPGPESEIQDAIELALGKMNMYCRREVELSDELGVPVGRIDFMVRGAANVGIEVKVAGSPSEVLRQVYGYLRDDRLDGLVLVSMRHRSMGLVPDRLHGKPVVQVRLSGSML